MTLRFLKMSTKLSKLVQNYSKDSSTSTLFAMKCENLYSTNSTWTMIKLVFVVIVSRPHCHLLCAEWPSCSDGQHASLVRRHAHQHSVPMGLSCHPRSWHPAGCMWFPHDLHPTRATGDEGKASELEILDLVFLSVRRKLSHFLMGASWNETRLY